MRKSDFIAFISTDYQEQVEPIIGQLNYLYRIVGRPSISVGYANGYVIVPKKCRLYEKSYIEIEDIIDIPYNFSYSGMLAEDVKVEVIKGSGKNKEYFVEPYWCFGFDTYRCNATKEEVVQATLILREQLIQICIDKGDKINKY